MIIDDTICHIHTTWKSQKKNVSPVVWPNTRCSVGNGTPSPENRCTKNTRRGGTVIRQQIVRTTCMSMYCDVRRNYYSCSFIMETETRRLQPFHRVTGHIPPIQCGPIATDSPATQMPVLPTSVLFFSPHDSCCPPHLSPLLLSAWLSHLPRARVRFKYTDARIAQRYRLSIIRPLCKLRVDNYSVHTTSTSHQNRRTSQRTSPRSTTRIHSSMLPLYSGPHLHKNVVSRWAGVTSPKTCAGACMLHSQKSSRITHNLVFTKPEWNRFPRVVSYDTYIRDVQRTLQQRSCTTTAAGFLSTLSMPRGE